MICPKCSRRIPKKSVFCLYCGSPAHDTAGEEDATPERRYCILCGRQLPELGVSDVCEGCLSGEVPDSGALLVPELPDTPIAAPRKTSGITTSRVILIATAALLLLVGLFVVLRLQSSGFSTDFKKALSETEQLAVSYAQEMVKNAAFDPSSVHFEQLTLAVEESAEIYTITQSFERRVADGSTAKSEYKALLELNEPDGYTPVRLEVDGELLVGNPPE